MGSVAPSAASLSLVCTPCAALRVEQHIIQRMTVRFLSPSVDDGVIVGVPVDAIGDVLVVRS